ncbi:MAG: DUF1772 domain-containing protein [Pyrinomonadaceae bacterium]
MDRLIFFLTLFGVVGGALIAGTFFIFSVAIMAALSRLPANEGAAAMQSINVVIQNPAFLGVFFGTAIVSLALGVLSFLDWDAGAGLLLAGALSYFIGSFAVTILFNVPLNNALNAADPMSLSGQEIWAHYLTVWTRWNHLRTLFSVASVVLLILAMVIRGDHPAK